MTRLNESPFEWKARHSSAPVPKCHNTMNTILRRASKAAINLKEAEMAYSRDLYYVARYVHVHAYLVKACCDNWVCVRTSSALLWRCSGQTREHYDFLVSFLFQVARVQTSQLHILSLQYFLYSLLLLLFRFGAIFTYLLPMTNFRRYSVLTLTDKDLA